MDYSTDSLFAKRDEAEYNKRPFELPLSRREESGSIDAEKGDTP
jgi:hypothetical protein